MKQTHAVEIIKSSRKKAFHQNYNFWHFHLPVNQKSKSVESQAKE